MYDRRRHVSGGVFAPAAEPAPSAVGELHFLQTVDARFDDFCQLGFIENGIVIETLPALGAGGCVADFLRVEIRALLLNGFEI